MFGKKTSGRTISDGTKNHECPFCFLSVKVIIIYQRVKHQVISNESPHINRDLQSAEGLAKTCLPVFLGGACIVKLDNINDLED